MSRDEQLAIAKEYVRSRQLSARLDESMTSLINTKEVFGRDELEFNRGTEQLNEYVDLVKQKLELILNT